MNDKRSLGQGNVDVVLTDEHGNQVTHQLKPSIHAMRVLSRKYGGLQTLAKRIEALEFDAVIDVLEVGLQITASPKARQDLEGMAYRSGMTELPAACIRFVATLLNGGKLPPDVPEQRPEGPLGGAS